MKKAIIIPLVLAICFAGYAFTTSEKETTAANSSAVKSTVQWEFIGHDDMDALDASNYQKLTGSPTYQCGSSDETVCTIFAEEDPNSDPNDPKPLFSNNTNPVDNPSLYEATRRGIQ